MTNRHHDPDELERSLANKRARHQVGRIRETEVALRLARTDQLKRELGYRPKRKRRTQ